jgi:hypothetical protein
MCFSRENWSIYQFQIKFKFNEIQDDFEEYFNLKAFEIGNFNQEPLIGLAKICLIEATDV